jgi:tRNA U34 5-methylaminomethyl-2-thiouridine-forming methyltransferase MnmC
MQNKHGKSRELLPTKDGSLTFFSERYGEHGHSMDGAWQETLTHYIEGCQVEKRLRERSKLTIFEVGLGIGIGLKATLEAHKAAPECQLHYLSCEIERDLLEHVISEFDLKTTVQKLGQGELWSAKLPQCQLDVLFGDVRETLPAYRKQFPLKVDCIYQDAFSPKRNPRLWSVQWFELLKSISKQDTLMSTYSASISIRKAMVEAGWKLQAGQAFGHKKSATRALLCGATDPEIQDKLERSSAQALRD